MNISTNPGVWVAAICTIGIMSFLYKDNIYFKTVESAFIGMGAAQALVLGYGNIRDLGIRPIVVKGDLMPLLPVILGIMLYSRFSRQYSWISRIPIGYLYGLGAAIAVRGTITSVILTQLAATVVAPKSINDVLIIVGVLSTITYFFFCFGQSAPLKRTGQLGRYFMMVAFGASFASTAMGRISIAIERLTFLWGTWLGMIR